MTQDAALRCTQRTQRKIEIDPILAFTTQHDASATEGVHKLKRNATQRLASYCEPAFTRNERNARYYATRRKRNGGCSQIETQRNAMSCVIL